MSRKQIFYIVFFVVLVTGFFITISFLMPGYLKPKFPPISVMRPFAFTNQDDKKVTDTDIKNKVVAVNFFFTTCKGICPRMNNNLKPVYEKFKDNSNFLILSHTCDPERDSAAQLKHYADSMKVDTRKWIFLTGRKDSLYSAARLIYKIDDPKNFVQNSKDDFLHTQLIALVNKKGEIVKIYDGIKPSEMNAMETEIQKLLKE
ncbi:MAG: SCO family protein [Flavisolibacter sp.]